MPKLPEDWLIQLQEVYPKRRNGQGWGRVKTTKGVKGLVPALIEDGETWADIYAGAKRYGDYCRTTNEQYVRMAQTFYGPVEWWREDYELPGSLRGMPEDITEEQRNIDRAKADEELAKLRLVK